MDTLCMFAFQWLNRLFVESTVLILLRSRLSVARTLERIFAFRLASPDSSLFRPQQCATNAVTIALKSHHWQVLMLR